MSTITVRQQYKFAAPVTDFKNTEQIYIQHQIGSPECYHQESTMD